MRATSPLIRTLFIAFCLFAALGALSLFSGRAFWSSAHRAPGSASAAFAPLVIDEFTTNQATISNPPGGATNVNTGGADMLGQGRDLQVNLLAGAGPVSVGVSGGTLNFSVTSTTPDSRGEAVITWDGDTDANVLSPTGLGGVDLTAMNNSTFRIRVNSAGAGTELVLTVYTNDSNASQAARRLPAVAATTDFFLSYPTDFIASLGSGANFANVGAITLTVRGTETSAVIDSIEAVPPGLTFTKQDLTLADASIGSTPQLPGTKIKYRMTITNTGGAATGLQLADMIDANTTLDLASLDTAPILRADAYATVGNVNKSVAVGAGLLANDLDADMNGALPALVVTTTGAVPTTLGGTATLNADGSFSYDPPAGVGHAVDTFTYSASDNEGNSNSATVTINLGPVIWFVDDAHAGLNLGTKVNPFVGFTAANVRGAGGVGDQDRPGDTIFLYAGAHVSGLELEAGQHLIGEGQGLVINGQTIVPAGTAPTISSTGNGIVLASNNTIRGLTVGDTAGVDLTGNNFGTLTVSNVTLNGMGGALNLTNGALVATFNSISSTNSPGRGINLEVVTGSLAVPGGTSVTDSAQAGIRVTNNGSIYDFGATTLNSTALGLELTDNSITTFNFASLTITPDSGGVGLLATNAGTLNIGGTGNTITTSNALALNVSSTSFGTGATFSAINVTGTAGAINLNTITGALTLSDTAINVSGGTAVVAFSARLNLDPTNTNSATVTATGQRAFTLTSVTTTGFNLATTSSTGTTNGIVASSCTGTFNFGDTTVTSSGNGIDLSSSASGIFTFDDLDVTTTAGIALAASSVNTVNVDTNDDDSPVLSATTRPVLDIDNTTIHLNLATLTSASPTTHGVDLTNILANSTLGVSGATTVTSPTSFGVNLDDIDAGSSLVFGNFSVTNRGSHGIFIQDHDGTTITFGDVDITNAGNVGGNGVHVQKSGVSATSTGSLTFASLDISSTNTTVNRADADGNAIPDAETHDGHAVKLIDHTGGLIVTGDGTQGNGGTIQNIDGDGFSLTRSGGLNLDELTINNIGVANTAAATVDTAGIFANNLVGANRISNSTISRFQDGSVASGTSHGLWVLNDGVSFTELRLTDVTMFNDSGSLFGDDAIQVVTQGAVNGSLIIESAFDLGNVNNNSEFYNLTGTGLLVSQNGSGTLTVSVSDTTFRDAQATGGFGGIELNAKGSGTLSNNIDQCLFYDLYPLGLNNAGVVSLLATGTSNYDATINNCTFGTSGERTSSGRGAIRAQADDTAGANAVADFDITITNNTIDDTSREAISILPRGAAVPAVSGQTMDILISGNNIGQTTAVANDAGLGREGIEFVAIDNAKIINLTLTNNTITNFVDSSSDETVDIDVEDNTTLNAVIRGNTFSQTGSTTDSIDIATEDAGATLCLDMNSANTSANICPTGITITETAGTFLIEDIGGAANSAATVDTFIEARNTGTAVVTGTFDSCNHSMALMPTDKPRGDFGQHPARQQPLPDFKFPGDMRANSYRDLLERSITTVAQTDSLSESRRQMPHPSERLPLLPVGQWQQNGVGFGNQARLLTAAYQAQAKLLALSKRWASFQPWFSFRHEVEPGETMPVGNSAGHVLAQLFSQLSDALMPTAQAHESLRTVAPAAAPLSGETLNLALGTLPAGQSLTVEFEVTIDNPVTGGATQIANQGTLSGSNFSNVLSDDPDTVAPTDPTMTQLLLQADLAITKSDSADPVNVNAAFSYTLDVANNGPSMATSITVTDTLPMGVGFVSASGTGWSCGESLGVVTCTRASLAVGVAPAITINVTAPASNQTISNTAAVAASEDDSTPGNNTDAETTLIAAQPALSKAFTPNQIPVGQNSTLEFTIQNLNAFAISDLDFSDMLPGGVTVLTGSSSTCGGMLTTTAPDQIAFNDGALNANSMCTFSVEVTGATFGQKNNTTSTITSANAGTGAAALAALKVVAPPNLTKVFTPASVALGNTSSLDFTVANPNTAGTTNIGLNGVGFADVLPVGLTLADATVNNACGAGSTLTVTAATRTIVLTNGTLGVGGNCNFSVTVTPTTPGEHNNIVNSITSTEGGTNNNAATATLNVIVPPVIGKAFLPASVPVGSTSTLTFMITNPATNTVSLTDVNFTDVFPNATNLLVANPPAIVINNCGSGSVEDAGGGALTAGDMGIRLRAATVGTAMPCVVSVNVTPLAQGPFVNVSGNVSSTNGGMGNQAMATLLTNTPPTISSNTVPVKAGSNAASFTIATAADPDQAVHTLGFTINGNPTTASSNGVTVSAVTLTPSGAVTASIATTCAATSATFALVVTDSQNTTGTGTLTVNATPNMPPMLTYNPQTVTAGTTANFNPVTGPSDNGTVNSIVLQNVTPNNGGLAVNVNNTTGQVQVTSATLSGVYTVAITATDNCNATTNSSVTINVSCPAVTLTPTSLPNGVQGTAYNQMVSAAPAGTTYSYAVTTGTLPGGLTLNSATGAISGTPTSGGNYAFNVTATGWGGCTKTQSYSLLITGTCATITVNPTSLPGATIGTAYNQTVSASPAGTYTYAVTQGALPPGLTLNSSSGDLMGTATSGGSFSFRITATGTGGCTGSRNYVLTVTCAMLTFAPQTMPGGTKNVPYNQTITVTPAGTYTFSLLIGSLPPGFTLSSAGVLSGVTSQTGTFNFTVKALGGTCQGTKSYTLVISTGAAALAQLADYNGDGKGDFALWSPSGTWRLALSGEGAQRQTQTLSWGTKGDLTLLGDYDGDGQTDLAVFRPANGTWYVKRSSDGSGQSKAWGTADDVPVPGDYDGDGQTDIAVFRPSDGHWYVQRSADGQAAVTAWGAGYAPYNDVAVPGDYDGDGVTDLAVFRRATGTWLVKRSSDGQFTAKAWGVGTDVPVAADYDGDGRTDFAVWRGGAWHIWQSATASPRAETWGTSAAPHYDRATPGDYDGDGQADVTVYRAADQTWYVRGSRDGRVLLQPHGQPDDRPVGVLREP